MTVIFFLTLALACLANSQNLTFTNPIVGGNSNQRSILRYRDYYYLALPHYSGIKLYKSSILTDFRNVESRIISRLPDGYIWMEPNEMVRIDGNLYLYLTMSGPGGMRLYVIRADNPMNPMGGWSDPIRLMDDWDYVSAHGTVLMHNKRLYFVWTNVAAKSSLLIAPMRSPTWVGKPKVLLREPREDWECRGECRSESASFSYSRNASYMIYSASAFDSPDFCLGQMSIRWDRDPLRAENWNFVNRPVFWKDDVEDVYATGRARFTVSPDGTETWMLYHATVSPVHRNGRRTLRLEKIEWNGDSSPEFPRPKGTYLPKPVPSGQTSTCSLNI